MNKNKNDDSANRDPITNAPGAHPVGVGVGAAGAGATGAAIGGAVGGPIGAAVGAVVGSVAGGLVGKGAAEAVNPTVEDAYWRENYKTRPYAKPERKYDDYQPAYRYGWEASSKHQGKTWDEMESHLEQGWSRQGSTMGWSDAKQPARDAWDRIGLSSRH